MENWKVEYFTKIIIYQCKAGFIVNALRHELFKLHATLIVIFSLSLFIGEIQWIFYDFSHFAGGC